MLSSPILNKGTAFTARERKELGLTGLLPPEISTLAAQVKLAYIQYDRLPDTLSKNAYLTTLHARNEILFYRLLSEHLREMIPVLDDVTVCASSSALVHVTVAPTGTSMVRGWNAKSLIRTSGLVAAV